ncbi:MAG: hypothetical protein ACREFE_20000 [Limisphaerales bacterium]
MNLAMNVMRRFLLKLSRAIFHWPPRPGSAEEKRLMIIHFSRKWGIKNLVETGTFEGGMVESQRENFNTIATIELGDKLYESAKQRFAAYDHIHVLHGDSGTMLAEAITLVEGPTLFWLDAHYSRGVTAHGDAETPILKELSIIAARKQADDVILIDDARLFGLRLGYPRLARVRKLVAQHWPAYSFKVESDIICIAPP